MAVLIPCLFSLFSILCKIIYMYLLYVVLVYEALYYAKFIFMPEMASLAFLTGAYAAELFMLIQYENRIYCSVLRIGKYRYKRLKGQKEWIFIGYGLILVIGYIFTLCSAMYYNRESASNYHHFKELEKALFLTSFTFACASYSFPLIAIFYALLTVRAKRQMVENGLKFPLYKQYVTLTVLTTIICTSAIVITLKFALEYGL